MKREKTGIFFNLCTVLGLLAMLAFLLYGIRNQIFVSETALEQFLKRWGIWAPVFFVGIQAIQVILPILPGAVGCLAGVLIFGPVWGFIYNYAGICAGSLAAFFLSRKYGRPFVKNRIGEKNYRKYIGWLEKGKGFECAFAAAIFFPVAPDDLLCYIAGLTKMTWKRFAMIILLGKPVSICLFSLGLVGLVRCCL